MITNLNVRATSIAIVQTIQRTKADTLLKVLFDTGSDKTMFKRSALPSGITPSMGRKRKIAGVRAVILENLTLPEFSSTQKVTGPIRAIIMDNDDTPHDLIIGMDLLQALGIDIHGSTWTIIWNSNRIPFKPIDYFNHSLFHTLLHDAMEGCYEDPEDDLFKVGYHSKNIRGSWYEKIDPHDVALQQKHLTAEP